jgi:hypothetical protein
MAKEWVTNQLHLDVKVDIFRLPRCQQKGLAAPDKNATYESKK